LHVATSASELGRLGCSMDVFTRRDSDRLPEAVDYAPNVRVVNVPAGPPRYVRKEEMLPLMDEFGDYVCDFARHRGGYVLSHANFFMSGLASLKLKERLGTPFVVTFHAPGRVPPLHHRE